MRSGFSTSDRLVARVLIWTATITADPGLTIRRSLDGADPTSSHPAVPSGTSVFAGNYTLKARGRLGDGVIHTRNTPVVLHDLTGIGATLNTGAVGAHAPHRPARCGGSTPTETNAEAVNGEIFVNASMTVRARVFVPGRPPSAVTAGAYVITP